jgi:hypothetical protein
VYNPRQPRDLRGRWTTVSGVLRAATKLDPEDFAERNPLRNTESVRRAKKADIDRLVKSIKEGTAPRRFLEYQHPRNRMRAITETGSPRKPTREAIRSAVSISDRGTPGPRRGEVVFNPLSGRFVATRGRYREVQVGDSVEFAKNAVNRASAVRRKQAIAVSRGRLATPTYSGRHRAS